MVVCPAILVAVDISFSNEYEEQESNYALPREQRRIQDPIKHLQWSAFCKNRYWFLADVNFFFPKKSPPSCF